MLMPGTVASVPDMMEAAFRRHSATIYDRITTSYNYPTGPK